MRRPEWFHEPEDFRRWRLGLEEREDAPWWRPDWPIVVIMVWYLVVWFRTEADDRSAAYPVVFGVLLTGQVALALVGWRRPGRAEAVQTGLAVVGGGILGAWALAAGGRTSGLDRAGAGLVAIVLLGNGLVGVWHRTRHAPVQDELDITR